MLHLQVALFRESYQYDGIYNFFTLYVNDIEENIILKLSISYHISCRINCLHTRIANMHKNHVHAVNQRSFDQRYPRLRFRTKKVVMSRQNLMPEGA